MAWQPNGRELQLDNRAVATVPGTLITLLVGSPDVGTRTPDRGRRYFLSCVQGANAFSTPLSIGARSGSCRAMIDTIVVFLM